MKRTKTRSTSFDVAALAAVSQSAVSRAFSPGTSISDAKRKRILEAARELDYVPNSIASSLTTKRSSIVAVVLGNLANPFYVAALQTLMQRLQAVGRQVLTFGVDSETDADEVLLRVLRYQVDGIILTSARVSTRMTSLCHDRGIPLVLFNRYIPGADAACVRCDNHGGGRLVAEAFLEAGARRFAVILGDPHGTTSADRLLGFQTALAERGVASDNLDLLEGQSTYQGATAAMQGAYADRPLPDAIFAVNDIMALGAMDVLRARAGVRIPEDIMVAGFDDIPEAARSPYRLTTVRQPIDEMVEETLSLLHLDDNDAPLERAADRVVPGKLVWRDTIQSPIGD